jgi:hypothetical protein
MYTVGFPVSKRKDPFRASTTILKAELLSTWQSVQWQMITLPGSISAS